MNGRGRTTNTGLPRDAEPARLFLALWPDDQTRAALARCRDAWIWDAGARPEPDERLHLTLHFLGAVPQQRLPELVDGLQIPYPRFALRLGRPERWSNSVAVLGLEVMSPTLLHLQAALCGKLEGLALPVDRRVFRPHVTLARNVGPSAVPPSDLMPVRWPVSGYALVQSLAANRGYFVLRHFD
jgi:2'-5' RNA ligase